ncbi:MAG: efflux RND transporter permease subunit, partial [Oligoflexus sp.]
MSIPALSVRRPVFIASIVLLMLFTGAYSLFKLPVSLFPETNVPFISITTLYPGAGPREVELAISKHLEDELSTIEGVKKTAANSQDSLSLVWVEFRTGINMDSVEQRVRDRVALAASKFPREAETPVIERFNPSNQPVITVFLRSKTKDRIQLTTWAEQELKPFFARIPKVGRIDILGGQRRQIDIVIDPEKISQYRIPLLQIANSLEMGGKNIPAGSLQSGSEEIGLRSVGQYTSLEDIDRKVVTFGNGETSIRVRDLGRAVESSERLKSKAFFGGEQGVVLQVYRQSGANTLAV